MNNDNQIELHKHPHVPKRDTLATCTLFLAGLLLVAFAFL